MHRMWIMALLLITVSYGSTIVPAQAQGVERCFAETNVCISGRMLQYWLQNGREFVFGLPITPLQTTEVEGRVLEVQWFERSRLELHPENAPPYDVLVSRLGADYIAQQGFPPREAPQEGCRYFEQTGYNVCGVFELAWQANGIELDNLPGKTEAENLALFGLPVTGAYRAVLSDGQEYLIQWFERARFELHPENPPPNNVLYGLLGREALGAVPITGTPAEQIAFVSTRDGNAEIYRVDLDGSNLVNLTNNPSFDADPAWSPDGSRMAFASNRAAGGGETLDIYVMNADGSNVIRLTSAGGTAPAWSPDGGRIAFERQSDIYVMNADGSNQVNLTATIGDGLALSPTWSPDSSRIAFSADFEREAGLDVEIYVINADGTGIARLTTSPGLDWFPAWSPDGSRMAFVSDRSGNEEIHVMNADGTNVLQLTNNPASDTAPAWSPDNNRIVYQGWLDDTQRFEVVVMNADGTNSRNLTTNPADDFTPAWRP